MSSWIVETLLASTMLMLFVLAVRQPVARLFGPRIAYALWLLPALRMVMPPLPDEAIRAAPVVLPMQQVFRPEIPLPLPPAAATAPVDWTGPLAAIWLAGAVLAFVLAMVGYARFVRRMRADARQLAEIDGVPVWATDAVEGPLAFGILQRAIALPADYADQFAPEELALALRHERMHHQRHDLIVNMAALVLRSIHWFNPVAHFAWRAFRADQEMACDAAVIAASGDRHTYALALWKSAWGRLPAAACAMNGKGQLKRRLGMINRKGNSRARSLVGGVAIVTLLGVGLGLTASGGIAAEQVQKKSHRIVNGLVLPGHGVATPPPPPVPATVKLYQVPDVPDAPNAGDRVEAPQPPEAPEAPEPPETPDMAAIQADVDAATAEAARATEEANRAMAEANRAMAECSRGRGGGPCDPVDMAEIRRDVLDSLQEAKRDLRDDDIPARIRAQVTASLDQAIARIESDSRWK